MSKSGYLYIMSNAHCTVLYIGVTSDLESRVDQHESEVCDGFTKKHNCKDLVYYEVFDDIELAIRREKTMKRWNRAWKERQIREMNPEMKRGVPYLGLPGYSDQSSGDRDYFVLHLL